MSRPFVILKGPSSISKHLFLSGNWVFPVWKGWFPCPSIEVLQVVSLASVFLPLGMKWCLWLYSPGFVFLFNILHSHCMFTMHTVSCMLSKHLHNLPVFVHLPFTLFIWAAGKEEERENVLLFPAPPLWTEPECQQGSREMPLHCACIPLKSSVVRNGNCLIKLLKDNTMKCAPRSQSHLSPGLPRYWGCSCTEIISKRC